MKNHPIKPYTAEWVKAVVAHPYTMEYYTRFQQQLRERRKYGLLKMMQQLLKAKQHEKERANNPANLY